MLLVGAPWFAPAEEDIPKLAYGKHCRLGGICRCFAIAVLELLTPTPSRLVISVIYYAEF